MPITFASPGRPRTADMSTTGFHAAMDSLCMMPGGMAATLGIAPRRVAAFRKDAPPAIVLAMRALSRDRGLIS